jgi:hypothetical protein
MPKGVYARKSAQSKTAAKPAKAKAKAAPAAELADKPVEQQFSAQDFRCSIDDMAGAKLKAYARRIGIMPRDVEGLSEDRLRQNCKARVLESMED